VDGTVILLILIVTGLPAMATCWLRRRASGSFSGRRIFELAATGQASVTTSAGATGAKNLRGRLGRLARDGNFPASQNLFCNGRGSSRVVPQPATALRAERGAWANNLHAPTFD
jgi:hypothetical protein